VTDYVSGDDDLPIIDVRSPAERATDAGRAGLSRLQERLRDSHLDIAAVVWMICLLALIALQVYRALRPSAFDFGDQIDGWQKASFIATSGNFVFAAGAMVGIALACAYSSTASRIALGLAVAAGLWVVIANIVGIAVAFHDQSQGDGFPSIGRGTEDKFVQALTSVMEGGLGLVVFFVAWSLLASGRPKPARDPEIAELA